MQPQQQFPRHRGGHSHDQGQERDDLSHQGHHAYGDEAGRSTALQEEKAHVKERLGAQPHRQGRQQGKAHTLQRLQPGPVSRQQNFAQKAVPE